MKPPFNKIFFLFCILLWAGTGLLAQSTVYELNKDSIRVNLKENRVGHAIRFPLKFNSNDSLIFAEPGYDDSFWPLGSTALDIDSLPDDRRTGVAWFRLKIKVDEELKNKIVDLIINQNGASEIYWDGKLIRTYGTLGIHGKDEEPFNPQNTSQALFLDEKDEHLLAIRYTYKDALDIYSTVGRIAKDAPLMIRFADHDNYGFTRVKILVLNLFLNLVLFGILITLTLVYFLIYLYRRSERIYLLFSLYTLNMSLIFFFTYNMLTSSIPSYAFIFQYFSYFFVICIFILLLSFLYSAFLPKMPVQLWIFLSAGWSIFLLTIVDGYLKISFIDFLFPVYVIVSVVEAIRMIIWSVIRKKEGAKIIGLGAFGFIMLIAFVFVVNLLSLQDTISENVLLMILYVGFISLPASMAVFLARTIGTTNKNLELKLEEVKYLSAYTLEQERNATELKLQAEREKAKALESELQTKAAESQAKILQLENDRKAKELEEARNLQLSMLPKEIHSPPHLEIEVYMQTAAEVGGDYYDFSLVDEDSLTIVLGDATGHGVKAGIMVSTVKSLFIHHSHLAPLEMINLFNKSLRAMKFDKLYMCLCAVKFSGYNMTVANAGIPPILIHRAGTNLVEEITLKSMPLGSFEVFPYKGLDVRLHPGDTVLIQSDGFPELFSAEGEMLDYSGARAVFAEYASQSPKEIINSLSAFIHNWRGGSAPNDDVSFIVMRVK